MDRVRDGPLEAELPRELLEQDALGGADARSIIPQRRRDHPCHEFAISVSVTFISVVESVFDGAMIVTCAALRSS